MLSDTAGCASAIVQNRQHLHVALDRLRHQQEQGGVERTPRQVRPTDFLNGQIEATSETPPQFFIVESFHFLGIQVLRHRIEQAPGCQVSGQFSFAVLKKQRMRFEIAINFVNFRQKPDGFARRMADAEPDTLARNQFARRRPVGFQFRFQRRDRVIAVLFDLDNGPRPRHRQFRGLKKCVVGIKQILFTDSLA